MIFTAESAFWTSGLWRRAFYVRRSLKGLHRPFERIFERKWNVIWTLFWTFFEMDKSCVPLPNLQSVKQKVLTLLAKFYCIWFCSAPTSMDRCLSKILVTWHGVLHQEMRRLRNLQFLCSLWQRGFFLHVNFSRFKTPPALHSVAKCFAASTPHWRLWKTKLQKLLDPKTLYESIFSSVFFESKPYG